ncbi:MAG: SDR family oxidoreductase [Truepera sp.]|nr:SDR family oxidoreductase [Truepera sp.]
MKLVIFGSTGGIGRQLVAQALEQGHTVAAFARNPSKLELKHINLRVVQGDALDPASVEKAVQGQDAVLSSLGAGASPFGTIRAEGTRNIVQAMEKTGARRLICVSTIGVGDSWDNLDFLWKYLMFGLLFRSVYKDHVRQEEYVKQSRLEWTIIRPAGLTDGDRTGDYRHVFPGTDKPIKGRVSRADVADFMLKELADRAYLHKTPGVSY